MKASALFVPVCSCAPAPVHHSPRETGGVLTIDRATFDALARRGAPLAGVLRGGDSTVVIACVDVQAPTCRTCGAAWEQFP